jgi:uncharacterized protein (TIGR03083 family)
VAGTDTTSLVSAFADQSAALLEWAGTLTPGELSGASTLDGWSVIDVLAHLSLSASMVAEVAGPAGQRPPRGSRALSLGTYISRYTPAADSIQAMALADATTGSPLVTLAARTDEALAVARAVIGDPVLLGRRGPIRFSDLLRTRLVELVVHGRDLTRSLPDHPPPLLPAAVRIVTKALVYAMAEQHPGRAVELRVPPYAAVQLLEGGSHTRGTPPNVVETDPVTFVDLASGRLTFAAAAEAGAVRASGIRADLGPYLPVLS